MEKASEAFADKFEAEIDSNVMELSLRDLHQNENQYVQTDTEVVDCSQQCDLFNLRLISEIARLNEACNLNLIKVQQQPDVIEQLIQNAAIFQNCAEVLTILAQNKNISPEESEKNIQQL